MEEKSNIILKIINYQFNDNYNYVIKDSGDVINLKTIYLEFINKKMNISDIKKIKFIHLGKRIDDMEINLRGEKDSNVYIFINKEDVDVKRELFEKVFTMIPSSEYNNHLKLNISTKLENLPLDDYEEVIEKPSNEQIKTINKKIIENFENKDFLQILKICYKNPELLNMVKSYISHGNVKNEIDFSKDYQNNYDTYLEELSFIKLILIKFNIDISDENIIKILNQFNGHLNLSIRYILCKCNGIPEINYVEFNKN